MSTPGPDSWQELFAPASDGASVTHHAVSRGGKPFLFLPTDNRAASAALEIYPAQTTKARLAKSALGLLLRLGLRPGLQKNSLPISDTDPFAAFLRATARVEPGEPFCFAVLSGNPSAPGRRHVFLLFNSSSQPIAVVKAGASSRAKELIAHETAILSRFGSDRTGLPKLTGVCELDNLSAFALEYIEGNSPSDDSNTELEKIFSSWVDSKTEIALSETDAWKRLVQSCAPSEMSEAVRQLATRRVHPVLMHGDFAPWNVKASHLGWTVLDWERGEPVGIPAWDWFHFVVQPAVLVRREATEATLQKLSALFASHEFQRYAAQTGIVGLEWTLALAYVEFCIHVTQQTEGLNLLKPLRAALIERLATKR